MRLSSRQDALDVDLGAGSVERLLEKEPSIPGYWGMCEFHFECSGDGLGDSRREKAGSY